MDTRHLRQAAWIVLAGLAAACGAATGPGSSGSSSPTPSASAPAPAGSGGAATVHEATVGVGGTSTTVLTDSRGRTLYYLTSDTAAQVKCTGGCAQAWPPLLSSGTPQSMGSLPGKLAVTSDPNGSQVTYNGHPLYLYAADSAAGQATGEGIKALGGVWHVATPALAAGAGSSGGSGGTPSGGGYGY